MTTSNFLAAGPSIAVVDTALDFFPDALIDGTLTSSAIPKVAYFFTTTSLLMGVSCFIWVPLANKYGRRPVYIASYLIYTAAALALVFIDSYGYFLAGRILLGFGAGAAETIAPITVADIFFLHQRGAMMSLYNCSLSIGVALGMVVSGLITLGHHWRTIYQVGCAIVGFVFLLIVFTFPESAYNRQSADVDGSVTDTMVEKDKCMEQDNDRDTPQVGPEPRFWKTLAIYKGALTSESLHRMLLRSFGLILLPSVLWAALVQAVTIGFLVAVSSNVSSAFDEAYGFESYQVGLCFVSAILGSLFGIPAGGHLGDKTADYFTRRNGGIREPEMRLPIIVLSLISTPLALVLYGVGIHHQLHWMVPTVGLGLCKLETLLPVLVYANQVCSEFLCHPGIECMSGICHRLLSTRRW